MNKRGFTLVELLAVLVVLAVISTIIFPVVSDIIGQSESDAYDRLVETIVRATKNWVSDNNHLLVEIDENDEIVNKTCYLELEQLKTLGYYENVDTFNPANDENINDTVININYDKDTNQYWYDVIDNGDTWLKDKCIED